MSTTNSTCFKISWIACLLSFSTCFFLQAFFPLLEVDLNSGSSNPSALQVRDEVEKYTQGKTTSSNYMESNPAGLQLPSVTLCPGFKEGVFESVTSLVFPHILTMHGRNKTMPTNEEEIWEWFKSSTYNLDEGIYIIRSMPNTI